MTVCASSAKVVLCCRQRRWQGKKKTTYPVQIPNCHIPKSVPVSLRGPTWRTPKSVASNRSIKNFFQSATAIRKHKQTTHVYLWNVFFWIFYTTHLLLIAHISSKFFFNVRKKQSMIILFLLAKILHTEFRKYKKKYKYNR